MGGAADNHRRDYIMPRHPQLVEPFSVERRLSPLKLDGGLFIRPGLTLHLQDEPPIPLIGLEDDEGPDFVRGNSDSGADAHFEWFDYQEEEKEEGTHE